MFGYFLCNDWLLRNDNTEDLYKSLSFEDKAIFNSDVTNVDWIQYVQTICMGLRKYIDKDGLKNTLYARKKLKWLGFANYIFFILYFYVIYKLLYFTYVIFSYVFRYFY